MKKIIIAILGLFLSSNVVFAQEEKEEKEDCDCGKFSVALLLGNNNFIESGTADTGFNMDSSVSARTLQNPVRQGSNSITNMVGVEAKYFLTEGMALSLTGGAALQHNPSYINIPAVTVVDGNGATSTLIPAYSAVIGEDDIDVHIAPGLQFYFKNKHSNRLLPYAGFAIPLDYSRNTIFNPTVDFNDFTPNSSDVNYGSSHVELVSFGFQGVVGIDYYLTKELFIGFDAKPFTISYAANINKVNSVVPGLESDNYTASIFTSYVFKIGFRL